MRIYKRRLKTGLVVVLLIVAAAKQTAAAVVADEGKENPSWGRNSKLWKRSIDPYHSTITILNLRGAAQDYQRDFIAFYRI